MEDSSRSNDVLVEVQDLTKHYGSIRAVDGITFEVRRGDVLGFLGPNAAGKTTAMKMICGFLEPDRGAVAVAGRDVTSHSLDARRRIGYLPENAPAYGEMTVLGFLEFVAEARELPKKDEAVQRSLELTGLQDVRHQTVDTLSKGYKRRVGLAQALIHDPEILILDEPTDGLDPNQKVVVQDLIRDRSESRAVILSTHILDEAEKVCNRAIIVSRGRILVDSTPAELIARAPRHNAIRVELEEPAEAALLERLEAAEWCDGVEKTGERVVTLLPRGGENHLLEAQALLEGLAVSSIEVLQGRLEDLFRDVTEGVAA
jgi:ABC-2 type transport system ATP-binding protein